MADTNLNASDNAIGVIANAIANMNAAGSEQNDGSSDQAGGETTTGGNDQGAAGGQAQERVFTQDEVSRMMAREKHQGKNSVYKELGIDPDDTSAIKMFKAFVESQKSKEEKQLEVANEQKQQMADMQNKLQIAETKASLMQAGIKGDYVDDAVTIAMAKLAADDSLDVETVAKDLKAKYSVWFGEGESGKDTTGNQSKKTTGQKGTGKAPNNSNSGNSTEGAGSIGKRLAEGRAKKPEKSFWS